jgi:hypothetical protein
MAGHHRPAEESAHAHILCLLSHPLGRVSSAAPVWLRDLRVTDVGTYLGTYVPGPARLCCATLAAMAKSVREGWDRRCVPRLLLLSSSSSSSVGRSVCL